jgi:hypothetical protein
VEQANAPSTQEQLASMEVPPLAETKAPAE